MCVPGACVKDILKEKLEDHEGNWEVELCPPPHRTIMACSVFKNDHQDLLARDFLKNTKNERNGIPEIPFTSISSF